MLCCVLRQVNLENVLSYLGSFLLLIGFWENNKIPKTTTSSELYRRKIKVITLLSYTPQPYDLYWIVYTGM